MSLKHAILGFLEQAPMSGYELHSYFRDSAGHFWPADQSQIYRTLSDLEAEELVKSRVIPQEGRPDRREYRILAKGKRVFEAWLKAPLPPDTVREPFLLKMFFADGLGSEGVTALIEDRIVATQQILFMLQAVLQGVVASHGEAGKDLGKIVRYSTLEFGIRHFKTELEWLLDLKEQVARSVPSQGKEMQK